MAHQDRKRSLLGEAIAKRLDQLGMSRREFCRRFNISRPTLHDLEFNRDKEFASATFEAIDTGLKWQAGTARAFHMGKEDAQFGNMSIEDRIHAYLEQILARLITMNIDELEREVLMLEEELYGRPLSTDEASLAVVRETVSKLLTLLQTTEKHEPSDAIT